MEKISGSAITKLLEHLIQDQTPLKLTLIDSDYENLVRITGLTSRKKTPHVMIDIPAGFEQAAADMADRQFSFEFTGRDHIKYAFTTLGAEIADGRICLKMPSELERKQRRELFRILAPAGTQLNFLKGADPLTLEVMNISIGGSLAAVVQTQSEIPDNAHFAIADKVKNVNLSFPPEILQGPIQIETVRIKRIRKNPQTLRYEVGLEFCKMSKKEQQRLTDLIYRLQRQYLRHRLPLDL